MVTLGDISKKGNKFSQTIYFNFKYDLVKEKEIKVAGITFSIKESGGDSLVSGKRTIIEIPSKLVFTRDRLAAKVNNEIFKKLQKLEKVETEPRIEREMSTPDKTIIVNENNFFKEESDNENGVETKEKNQTLLETEPTVKKEIETDPDK